MEFDSREILPRDLFDDKLGILDIRAKLNNDIDCDIEMQVVDQKNIEKRILFYLSKMYGSNLHKGQNYDKLHKCIAILFTDFKLDILKDIPKYITTWTFREEKNPDIILTDDMEIYIIELPKVQQYMKNSKLDTWVNFINKVGDFDMDENVDEGMKETLKQIKKAKKVLEEISNDEHERYLAHLREKYILDQRNLIETGYERGFEKGVKDGIEQGIEQGIERGIEQGSKQEKVEIAKEMKNQNYTIEEIQKITKLNKEEIEKL